MKKNILLLLIFLILIGCNSKEETVDVFPKIGEFEVKLVAVGDNLIHETVYQAAFINDEYDFKPMLSEIKPYIQAFDLAFINQEAIIGGKEIGLSTYPCFNSPYELGDALIDSGFNMISIANNHTLDRGEKAVLNTIKYWDQQGVIFSGATENEHYSQVRIFTKNSISFAFVAYTYGTNGIKHPKDKFHLANVYSNEKAKADIEAVRDIVDVVIVSMHWGIEYQEYPSKRQLYQAQYLSHLGVDIILGHHPHVIQPIDMIKSKNGQQTFVVYSMGNFLNDQTGIDRLIGMAASITINKTISFNKVEIKLQNPEAKLIYRHKDYLNNSFNIKLFENLNDNFLKDYQLYFIEKRNLIQTYYKDVIVS